MNEVTPIFPGWESWTFRPFLPDHSAAAWVLWVTPDTLLLAGHSRIKPSFPEVSCDLFTILKTPTKTGQYPHTASIPYTKASCTEFSQELRTVIYLIMLLPTDRQRTFLPSNVLTINASNTLCKKQFLTKKISLVLETASTSNAQQCVWAFRLTRNYWRWWFLYLFSWRENKHIWNYAKLSCPGRIFMREI